VEESARSLNEERAHGASSNIVSSDQLAEAAARYRGMTGDREAVRWPKSAWRESRSWP